MKHGEASLREVLEFRDWKAGVQNEFMECAAEGTVISLGMNIPGPVKCSSSILSAFREGRICLQRLIEQQNGRILQYQIRESKAGCAAIYLVVSVDPFALKKESVRLEQTHLLGRLFDIDVLEQGGKAVGREQVGADGRRCLLCEQPAKVCGRNRTHSVALLAEKTTELIAYWQEYVSEEIGHKAYRALLDEVYTTPKPGLVDLYSCGAHKDMTVETFEKSAEVLRPYFDRMAWQGLCMDCTEQELFEVIRKTGMEAEKAMYEATGGVNTHKGLIFTLGIYCAAAGRCRREYGMFTKGLLRRQQIDMTAARLKQELEELKEREAISHGEKNLKCYGTEGIRGEAIAGYPSVWEYAYDVLHRGILEKRDYNLVRLQTFFTLMSFAEDSNILARKDPDTLYAVQKQAADFLEQGGAYAPENYQSLFAMDMEYTHKNISAGGCADLLAAAIFMELILNDDR